MSDDAELLPPERHHSLKPGEAFCAKMPDPNCRRCYGRGTKGHNETTGLWEQCRCLGRVSWSEKLAHHVRIATQPDESKRVTDAKIGRVEEIAGSADRGGQ